MRIRSFEFNLRELAGSFGDFGTLFPLAIGYIAVCGLDPAGFLIMMGVANLATGLIYQLPMPIEPMKVLAVVAIAQQWPPSLVYASGIAMGAVWLVFGMTGVMGWIAKVTPRSVIRGIQISLGVLLAIQAIKMILPQWWLGLVAVGTVLGLRNNRYAPAAVVLVALGIALMTFRGELGGLQGVAFTLPPLTTFRLEEVWRSLLLAGFAQIPLTATNAVIATSALITKYWPDRPLCVNAVTRYLGISQPAVSQHLAVLRRAGLVKGEKNGYMVHYALNPVRLKELRKAMEHFPGGGFPKSEIVGADMSGSGEVGNGGVRAERDQPETKRTGTAKVESTG